MLSQSDGSAYIIFNTQYQTFITKRKSNGATDRSYGKNGFSEGVYATSAQAVLQPDGKIVGAGTDYYSSNFIVFRYNTNGSPDATFGNDGVQASDFTNGKDFATSVVLQSDGKIVVAGSGIRNDQPSDFVVARYKRNGSLDSSFNIVGYQVTDFNAADNNAASVLVQSDGKIVVTGTAAVKAGSSYNVAAVVRYNTNGTLDNTFSGDGRQTIKLTDDNGKQADFYKASSVIQKDGKIVIAGSALARLNTDGTRDIDFGKNGIQKSGFVINAAAIQNDEKIVVAGIAFKNSQADFGIARYNTDGSPDTGFSDDGTQTTDFTKGDDYAYSVSLQADGKILVAGSDVPPESCHGSNCAGTFAAARYNTNGTLDNTFSKDGKITGTYGKSSTAYIRTAAQKDGKIVVIGSNNNHYFVERFETNGMADKTFGKNGIVMLDFYANALALQSDGKIVLSGSLLARFNTNGSPDSTFGVNGKASAEFSSLVKIQKDGKIVVAGTFELRDTVSGDNNYVFAVGRYNTDGSIDSTFDSDGKQTSVFNGQYNTPAAIDLAPDGKIVAAGYTGSGKFLSFVIVRYNINGSLDTSFNGSGWQIIRFSGHSAASAAAVQNDGKIIVGGNDFEGGRPIARFNTNGSLDSTFSGDGVLLTPLQYLSSIIIQNDNKIIVAGGQSDFALARYNTNGDLDSTFNKNGIQVSIEGSSISSIVIHDDKLYAAGSLNILIANQSLGTLGVLAKYLLGGNAPPVVNITTPVSNATFTAPATIKITASATAVSGTISKVEFYNGSTLLHTETLSPYGFTWRNVSVGNYTLTAKATDNSGLVTISAVVNIRVVANKAATVSITNPANNQLISGPATIHLSAAAKDPDGTITKVEFYNGKTLLHTETAAPYTYNLVNAPVGNYTLTAAATDNSGLAVTSAAVNISVVSNLAPTVSITNPADSESFAAPAHILLSAAAKDPDGTISTVEFYNGTELLGKQYFSPYSFKWNNVSAGTYKITAKAIDNLGLSAVSAPVTITVSNTSIVSNRPYSKSEKTAVNDALDVRLSPNPASNLVNIYTSSLPANRPATLSIISISGNVLKTNNIRKTVTQLDVSSLAGGVYTLKIVSGNKVIFKQFVRQ